MSGDSRGSIVCVHVANGELPLLFALRDEPFDDADSGWQFHCNTRFHTHEEDGCVLRVGAVLALVPSLSEWIEGPPGTCIERPSAEHPWRQVDRAP